MTPLRRECLITALALLQSGCAASPKYVHEDKASVRANQMPKPGHARHVVVLGAAYSEAHERGEVRHKDSWVGGVSASRHLIGYSGALSVRYDQNAELAGGPDGMLAAVEYAGTIGGRFILGHDQGLVGRGGLDLSIMGTNWFWLDLPQVDLGYQFATRNVLFEVGPQGAVTLGISRLHKGGSDDDATARLTTGGYLRLGWQSMFLSADLKLMPAHTDRSDLPFAYGRVAVCSVHTVAVCSVYMRFVSDVHFDKGPVERLDGNLFQFVVGFGAYGAN